MYAGHVLRLPTPYKAAPPKEKRLLKRAGGSVSFLRNFGSTFNLSSGHHSGRKARVLCLSENVLNKQEHTKYTHSVRSITRPNVAHALKLPVNPRIHTSEQQFRDDLNRLLSSLQISSNQDHSRTSPLPNGQLWSNPRKKRDQQEKKVSVGAEFTRINYLS
jgi:hypothetical protein